MKILVSGLSGKMGKAVYNAATKTENCTVICGVDKSSNDFNIPTFADFKDVNLLPDVIIDFSRPELLDGMLSYAVQNNVPLVIATTGYTDIDLEKINAAAKKIAIFKTANYSVAVNLTVYLCKIAKKVLNNSTIKITETHHVHKIDAPSGTAKMINDALGGSAEITSIRQGEVVGIHEVDFDMPLETLTIKHSAKDRSLFALGALTAAQFIVKEKCGRFDMEDILKEIIENA